MENTIKRTCCFCNRRASYDDFPDGSICYLGILACADCLKTEKTAHFRVLLAEEAVDFERKINDETLLRGV